jgi:hypothetical protein
MEMYLIAVKREKRREMSLARAVQVLQDVPGVKVLDDPTESSSVRVVVKDGDLEQLSSRLSQWCNIESLIEHFPQQAI